MPSNRQDYFKKTNNIVRLAIIKDIQVGTHRFITYYLKIRKKRVGFIQLVVMQRFIFIEQIDLEDDNLYDDTLPKALKIIDNQFNKEIFFSPIQGQFKPHIKKTFKKADNEFSYLDYGQGVYKYYENTN